MVLLCTLAIIHVVLFGVGVPSLYVLLHEPFTLARPMDGPLNH